MKKGLIGVIIIIIIIIMQKHKTFIMGNTNTCSINCCHRIAAALYALGTWFVSRI